MIRKALLALFLAFTAVPAVFGITVTSTDPNTNYLTTPGGPFDGVVEVFTNAGLCSGALIGSRTILTAAHCATNGAGTANVDFNISYVLFDLYGGPQTVSISAVAVAPGWAGVWSGNLANDLAVLTLSDIAPTSEIYSLYSGAPGSELGQSFTLAGYGYGGTAATGIDTSLLCPGAGNPLRCKRAATNVYDATASPQINELFDGGVPGIAWSNLVYDLNSGSNGNALQGVGYSLVTTALEGTIAPGDSGGPSFINGQIAGVHSFITCIDNYGSCANYNGAIHDYLGDLGADTEVAQHAAWITSQIVSDAPEPGSWFAGACIFAGVLLAGARKRGIGFATMRFWDSR